MKKYISLLSIAAVLLMQSCERSDSDAYTTEQRNPNMQVQNPRESTKAVNNSFTVQENSDSLEEDSKDEPKRDKQHWKSKKDTIYNIIQSQ